MKPLLCALICLATPAYAEPVSVMFSGVLSAADGDFAVGQKFTGSVSYDREEYDTNELYPHFIDFNFSVGDLNYTTDVVYASFDTATGTLSLGGERSSRTTLDFFGLQADPGFLPTADQFRGATGFLSFNTVRGTGEDSDPIFSFGQGTAVVAAVPEPATWTSMIAGFALAGAAMRYRRRTQRTTFA